VKLENSWGTSHSLCQRLVYDSSSSQWVTLALGDPYNEAITASIFSLWTYVTSTGSLRDVIFFKLNFKIFF
jgi:hypothetical protein